VNARHARAVTVEETRSEAASTQSAEVLRFENVSVRFDDKPALVGVSLQVNAGETVVLCGAATSGKTVLLKTAIGLIQPASGQVHLCGNNITGRQEEELFPLRRRVGFLFQEGGLFDSMTVDENVSYPLVNGVNRELSDTEVENRVKEVLDFVGLKLVGEKYPSELSGGMRRRVGIARAIVTRPPLILYDSPTAGLDPITAYRIIALVMRQRDTRNTTSIVVTHRHQDGYLLANYRHDPQCGRPVKAGNNPSQTRFLALREARLAFQGSLAEMEASPDPYTARFAGRKIAAVK
jgi:phospholipid/cholesterol/gamma-HCH transport system ATP-binding protein